MWFKEIVVQSSFLEQCPTSAFGGTEKCAGCAPNTFASGCQTRSLPTGIGYGKTNGCNGDALNSCLTATASATARAAGGRDRSTGIGEPVEEEPLPSLVLACGSKMAGLAASVGPTLTHRAVYARSRHGGPLVRTSDRHQVRTRWKLSLLGVPTPHTS